MKLENGTDVQNMRVAFHEAAGKQPLELRMEPEPPQGLRLFNNPKGTTVVGDIGSVSADGEIYLNSCCPRISCLSYLVELAKFRKTRTVQEKEYDRKLKELAEVEEAYEAAQRALDDARVLYNDVKQELYVLWNAALDGKKTEIVV